MTELNIERFEELQKYLRENARISPGESPRFTGLPGGVSNRTVLVEPTKGDAFVIKQALPKLRVATEWISDPSRSHREALGLQWLVRLAPSGTITPFLFEDRAHNLVAMQAVPRPHENWKTRLLNGQVETELVGKFGRLLGTIHQCSREFKTELASVFEDRSFFDSLRLDPYYRFTATQNPSAASFFSELISETRLTREALVHGDYSPKNALIHHGCLILLDHEVIHWGDPAFDLGFSMTHFLSKANHLASRRDVFLEAAENYWRSYREVAGDITEADGFERRVVRHTLGCLLARVDGRSPLEYLNAQARDRQRAAVLNLIGSLPIAVVELIERFGRLVKEFLTPEREN